MQLFIIILIYLFCLFVPCSSFAAISSSSSSLPLLTEEGAVASSNVDESNSPSSGMSSNIDALLLVDVENVRGKSNFQMNHETFLARACAHHANAATATTQEKNDNVLMVLVMDHGSQATVQAGGPLSNNVVVAFAGPGQKADNVIMDLARVSWNQTRLVVVSSDNEVIRGSSNAAIINPVTFLEELNAVTSIAEFIPKMVTDDNSDDNKPLDSQQMMQKEVAARQELQMVDRLLNPRRKSGKNISRKQRSKLMSRQLRAKERLTRILEDAVANGGTTLASAMDVDATTTSELESLAKSVEEASRAQIRRGAAETTYERQLLAERLRRRMEDAGALTRADIRTNDDFLPRLLATAHAAAAVASSQTNIAIGQRFRNPDTRADAIDGSTLGAEIVTVKRNHRSSSEAQKPLRILVMSDTHGMENQLFKFVPNGKESPYHLPDADILIHCGDFWGNSRSKAKQLDTFFAAQTHIATKIVIRGNHDPRTPGSVLFPKSRAMYVTKSATLELDGGIVVALRPHSRNYNEALLPPKCDIFVTHEPPYGILDYTYHDQRAGSSALRHSVETSAHKPSLWLCGHIHEARGARRHLFSEKKNPRPGLPAVDPTLVVNAASANEGKARVLVNGPVLIDLVDASHEMTQDQEEWIATPGSQPGEPQRLLRPDSLEALALAEESTDSTWDTSELRLLAVDLGLRTGTAVFDSDGVVLAVDSWYFKTHETLLLGLTELLSEHAVTHVIIEGEDRKLYNIWSKAIESFEGVQVARVVADDWRRLMLSKKEMRDARKAKSAAGMIAKQILKRSNNESLLAKKLSADAAEALLIGCYALRVLGWDTSAEPLVQRYTNGQVRMA